MNRTFIEYYGPQTSKCGYCRGNSSSESTGMQAYAMSPEIYQDLIDRGWRRSGSYCYKADMKRTCCPLYTIRCDVTEFQLSKSHKKVLKRMQRFLRDGKRDTNDEKDTDGGDGISCNSNIKTSIQTEVQAPIKSKLDIDFTAMASVNRKIEIAQENKDPTSVEVQKKVKSVYDPNQAPCKKAKQIRQERRQAKGATGPSNQSKTNQPKSLADFIYSASDTDKHKLKLVLIASKNKNVEAENFDVYFKYQTKIHEDAPTRLTPTSFSRFLYKSPIEYNYVEGGPADGYGSFHQQYWLDDKLIAVGVIDILPSCVSSVYFFYDPDYSFLSLGTYGTLREIDFTQQLCRQTPALKNYYMGFYIHTCPKMRYKGQLVPSYLLCPETYTWHLLTDEIRKRLDENKYQRMNEDANANDADEFKVTDLPDLLVYLHKSGQCSSYGKLFKYSNDKIDTDKLVEYGRFVGRACAHRMLYIMVE